MEETGTKIQNWKMYRINKIIHPHRGVDKGFEIPIKSDLGSC